MGDLRAVSAPSGPYTPTDRPTYPHSAPRNDKVFSEVDTSIHCRAGLPFHLRGDLMTMLSSGNPLAQTSRLPLPPTGPHAHPQAQASFSALPAELVTQVAEELRTLDGSADVLRLRQVDTRTRNAIDRTLPGLNANESAKHMLTRPPGPVPQLRSFVTTNDTASTVRAHQVRAELQRQNRRAESAIALVTSITQLNLDGWPKSSHGYPQPLIMDWRHFYVSSMHAMQNLDSLCIDNVDENESALVALSLLPSLRVLDLDCRFMDVEVDGLRRIALHIPPFLTSLSIVDHAISLAAWSEWLINLPPTLSYLKIADEISASEIEDEAIAAVSELAARPCKATRLRTLELRSLPPGASKPHLAYLLGAQTCLKTLKIHSRSPLAQVGDLIGAKNTRSVVHADFSNWGNESSVAECLRPYLKNSQSLTLQSFWLREDDFIGLSQRTGGAPLALTLIGCRVEEAVLWKLNGMLTVGPAGESRKLIVLQTSEFMNATQINEEGERRFKGFRKIVRQRQQALRGAN